LQDLQSVAQEQEKLKEFIDEIFVPVEFALHHPYGFTIFLCQKERRIATPYSRLPKVKQRHNQKRYPLPLISELIDKLGNAKIFSKMDVRWGYNKFVSRKMTNGKQPSDKSRLFEPTVSFSDLPIPCHLPIIYEFDFQTTH